MYWAWQHTQSQPGVHVREKQHRLLLPHLSYHSLIINLLAMSLYMYLPQYNYPTPYIPNLPLFLADGARARYLQLGGDEDSSQSLDRWWWTSPPTILARVVHASPTLVKSWHHRQPRYYHMWLSLASNPSLQYVGAAGNPGLTTGFLWWLLWATGNQDSGSSGSVLCVCLLSTCLHCNLQHSIPITLVGPLANWTRNHLSDSPYKLFILVFKMQSASLCTSNSKSAHGNIGKEAKVH